MPNQVTLQPVVADPSHISQTGGSCRLQITARTTLAAASVTVTVSLPPGKPYTLSGSPVTRDVTTDMKPLAAVPVRISATSAYSETNYLKLQVKVSIPGHSANQTVYVYIDDPVEVKLKDHRAGNSQTQADLAAVVGLSVATISRVERGLRVSPDVEKKIAELFK